MKMYRTYFLVLIVSMHSSVGIFKGPSQFCILISLSIPRGFLQSVQPMTSIASYSVLIADQRRRLWPISLLRNQRHLHGQLRLHGSNSRVVNVSCRTNSFPFHASCHEWNTDSKLTREIYKTQKSRYRYQCRTQSSLELKYLN